MRIVVVRQRPSIGDCLLLGPLLREVKLRYPGSTLTVITDAEYMDGALPCIFGGLDPVDRVECIPPSEWNPGSAYALPPTVQKAALVLNCNDAFLQYEQDCHGNVQCGIAEFWLRHFGYHSPGVSMLPFFKTSPEADLDVDEWVSAYPSKAPMIGVVMRAGHPARNWDYGLSGPLCTGLYTKGYIPVCIDTILLPKSNYARAFMGRPLDQVASLLKCCALVITPDTGLLHLAQAVGTPTVALWGIMDPKLRVAGYNTVVVPPTSLGYCAEGDRSCRCPWGFQRWSCLRRLTLDQILRGVEAAVNK